MEIRLNANEVGAALINYTRSLLGPSWADMEITVDGFVSSQTVLVEPRKSEPKKEIEF